MVCSDSLFRVLCFTRVGNSNEIKNLAIRSHRYHDGIVVSKESIELNHITIPTLMDGYTYHVNIHNDGSKYMGLTTDEPHSSKDSIDNFQWPS
jgi:hypothetical protein